MFRRELCEIVRDKINADIEKKSKQYNYAEVNQIVTTALDLIMERVTRGEEVNLLGFGRFERVIRPSKTGINNFTGKKYVSEEHGAVKFKPSPIFKEMVR